MKTQIPVLDHLLGWEQKNRPQICVPQSQVMLIRGAPGSGKTTLALEILARNIIVKDPAFGIFISLEVDPLDAWKAVVQRLSPEVTARLPSMESVSKKGLYHIFKNERTTLLLVGREWCQIALPFGSTWDTVETRLNTELTRLVNEIQSNHHDNSAAISHNVSPPFKRGLVVIDSINLLGEHLQVGLSSGGKHADMRTAMYSIWAILEKQRTLFSDNKSPCNLILTGEHHPGAPYDVSLLSESFACDIELLLAAEPIAGTPTTPINLLGTLGYSYERTQLRPNAPQSVEIRSFCRILKSRFTANQSRRCAYDIVSGHGVKFEEKYPGDGALLLFFENAKQKFSWDQFLTRDVSRQFPSLRYELFDRPGMQRTFGTQLTFNKIHQKTDMSLVCFDTYWVNSFWQLGQRLHLQKLLSAIFPDPDSPTAEDRHKYSAMVNSDETVEQMSHKRWMRFLCSVDGFAGDAIQNYNVYELTTNPPQIPKTLLRKFVKMVKSISCKEWLEAQSIKRINTPGLTQADSLAPVRRSVKIDVSRCIFNAAENLVDGTVGLLQPIPKADLRLFGEQRSDIIWELESKKHGVHLPRSKSDQQHFLSIPYNANVSFLVCNTQLVTQALNRKLENNNKWETSFKSLVSAQESALRVFANLRSERVGITTERESARELQHSGTEFDEGDEVSPSSPMTVSTLEDLFLLCTDGNYFPDDITRPPPAPMRFGIETQTYDSFLCSFLEVFWGCGGELAVTPEYEIRNPAVTSEKLFQAFFLFREMFRHNVIDRDSTLDPSKIQQLPLKSSGQWMFARHWYSTFVDILTAKKMGSKAEPWLWMPGRNSTFEIQPLPFSAYTAIMQNEFVKPVSCWGEWHFAVLNGTENRALAIEMLNNLMSSTSICERASRGAAVPTVEEFYKRYKHIPCLTFPERNDIKPLTFTYNDLRQRIFKCARSRSSIFDYRHCMREIHSVLTITQQNPLIPIKDLAAHVLDALERIASLRHHGGMMH